MKPTRRKPLEQLERPYESLTAKAWGLADAGHLTEAEIEFAQIVTGHDQLANPRELWDLPLRYRPFGSGQNIDGESRSAC